ncbi:hypothetical protein [Gorillibacterium sp. sgz5001074]
METLWGVICVLLPCLFAIGVMAVVNRNIRSFDESTHERFLG